MRDYRLGLGLLASVAAFSHSAHAQFVAGDLVISTSTFQPNTGEAANLAVGQPIFVDGTNLGVNAVATDANLGVFTNSAVDGNFGITAPLTLSSINPLTGTVDSSETLPTSQIVTSFSSKSEGSLSLSPDGRSLTVVGYHVTTDANSTNPVGALDVSNSSTTANTLAAGVTAGNSPRIDNRTIANVNAAGQLNTTDFTAYSGNNGRAAVLVNGNYYVVGNGNLGNTGVEQIAPGTPVGAAGTNNSTQIGSYSVTQNGYTADKPIKDNNFRGETVYNGTLYVTKGSGSNGIDTVYQVGATGALNNGGNLSSNAAISILPGFPTGLAKTSADYTPFGLFFANNTTLYVTDEGTGTALDASAHAGLEKWSLVGGVWVLDYTLRAGLIGTTQTYNAAGFTGIVTQTGLRDLTGVVNADGTVSFYAVTATTDNITNMDNGADPNELVDITDTLADTTLPNNEQFSVLEAPQLGTVVRGVAIAPVPEPMTLALFGTGLTGLGAVVRRRRNRA